MFFNCKNIKLNNILFKSNNKRYLEDNNPIDNNFCEIKDFFNQTRTCKINLDTANLEIKQALTTEIFMGVILNSEFQMNGKISTKEDNEIFTISQEENEETILLRECDNKLRTHYNLGYSGGLIIYKHEYISDFF